MEEIKSDGKKINSLPESSKDSKGLSRKPSFKNRKLPEVRQTLTSYRRILNANPLLKYEREGINIDQLITDVNQSGITHRQQEKVKPTVKRSQSLKTQGSYKPFVIQKRVEKIIAGNGPNPNNQILKKQSINSFTKSKLDFDNTHSKILSSTRVDPTGQKLSIATNCDTSTFKIKGHTSNAKSEIKKPPSTLNCNQKETNKLHGKTQRKDPSIRRSRSAQNMSRNEDKKMVSRVTFTGLKHTQSAEDLSPMKVPPDHLDISPIPEENLSNRDSLHFKTPSAYERRSIINHTPRSTGCSKALFRASTPRFPTDQQLQERLNNWLTKRGKSLSTFHHLKCFGLHGIKPDIINVENKENIETYEVRSSLEELEEKSTKVKTDFLDSSDLEKIASEALSDLLILIQEGYPREQCEGWLKLIGQKFNRLDESPQYWECRAAIEQSVGNIVNAVECYRTAIVQGAEVNNVDKSLDHLLQKFSLLNINTGESEKKSNKENERIIREARNVFKSSIIQFAVQERKLKKKDNQDSRKLVATPVRRSTRLSRSGYVKTPGVQLCSSLKELNLSDDQLDFHKNKALC